MPRGLEKSAEPGGGGMKDPRIVTLDGPSASGKSTVARLVAARSGRLHVDSGALYRAVAWQALEQGVLLEEADPLRRLLDSLTVAMEPDGFRLCFRVNGQPLGSAIRTPAVSAGASTAGRLCLVREWVNGVLRRTPEVGPVVVDGRDIGTVVFPHARYKFFLDADLETRARRRYAEWQGSGLSFEAVLRETAERDRQDRERALAPLTAAPDAVVIDTSCRTAEEVAALILDRLYEDRDFS